MAWPLTGGDLGCMTMAETVDQVISTLAEGNGLLRCRHGGRLIVLYGRDVATVEVSPRGAVS